jgi:hypothetical protein
MVDLKLLINYVGLLNHFTRLEFLADFKCFTIHDHDKICLADIILNLLKFLVICFTAVGKNRAFTLTANSWSTGLKLYVESSMVFIF